MIAPLRVISTSWPSDLAKWADFADLTHVLVHGERVDAMNEDVDVYLMNNEGLLSAAWVDKQNRPTRFALDWLNDKRTMLVVDESTNFKSPKALRFKILKKYLHLLHYPTILTGTPQPNKIEDLFAQCFITDQGKDLGSFITKFRHDYMVPNYNGYGFSAQPGAPERLAAKIAPTTLQLEYEEAVPSQVVQIWVQMPDKVRTFYDELKKEFIAVLGDKLVIAPNAASVLNKLRQVAQGAIYRDEEEVGFLELHGAKLDALENLLAELNGDPLFCLTQYRHDAARISTRLKKVIPYIGSGTSAKVGAEYVAQFSHGHLPLLLGHPQSVAHGIDGLQNSCNNICWFGLPWSWEQFYQGNLRVVRHGSKAEQVYIYQILTDCGVERAVLESITSKRDSEEDFLTLLRGYLTEDTV